jgi:hypothetical protein
MHFMPVAPGQLALLTPPTRIRAQLIKRGETPEIISDGVEISYRMENPQTGQRLPGFWAGLKKRIGDLAPPTGSLGFDEESGLHISGPLAIEPFDKAGAALTYPVLVLQAKDVKSGKILARTKMVAAGSAMMGCANCHGGGKTFPGGGLGQVAARDILATHDRMNKTDLIDKSKSGMIHCQDCHPDPELKSEGNPKLLNISAAIHGFHAVYLGEKDQDACLSCHPVDNEGLSRSLRSMHAHLQMTCTDCHGYLEDHASSLLLNEQKAGKPGAKGLLEHIKPRKAETFDGINPRIPWQNQPDCLSCHEEFQAPEETESFNQWTGTHADQYRNRKGEVGGVACLSCHSAPHALYPGLYRRDSLQPLQYQETPYTLGADENCKLCHTVDMEDEGHHANSLRKVRNPIEQDK